MKLMQENHLGDVMKRQVNTWVSIYNKKDLLGIIHDANSIYIRVRFFDNENWHLIKKNTARSILRTSPEEITDNMGPVAMAETFLDEDNKLELYLG